MIREFLDTQCPELRESESLKNFILEYHCPKIWTDYEKDQKFLNRIFIKYLRSSPLICVKDEKIARIINAHRCKQVILDNHFQHIDVPKKCLLRMKTFCAIPPKDLPLGYHDIWHVVAEAIPGSPAKGITLSEIKELASFVILTGYQDFGGDDHNILRDLRTKKIVFIDTEAHSFCNSLLFTKKGLIGNLHEGLQDVMTPEAKEWLGGYYETLKLENDPTEITTIPRNTTYDRYQFDYTTIRNEFDRL